jgi:hypothetical protein
MSTPMLYLHCPPASFGKGATTSWLFAGKLGPSLLFRVRHPPVVLLLHDWLVMASRRHILIPLAEGSSARPYGSLETVKSWTPREVSLDKVSHPSWRPPVSWRGAPCLLLVSRREGPTAGVHGTLGSITSTVAPRGLARTIPTTKGHGPNKLRVHVVACVKTRFFASDRPHCSQLSRESQTASIGTDRRILLDRGTVKSNLRLGNCVCAS